MTKEQHEKAVNDLKAVSEKRKGAAEKLLAYMDPKVLAFGSLQARAAQRKAFIAAAIRGSDPLIGEAQKIGKRLFEAKRG